MKPIAKAGLVVAGYLAAFIVAFAVVAIQVAATSGAEQQASSGMYAFGDSLLFLAVFGVAAVPPSAAALFFLRPCRSFWLAHSVVALGIAATALAALADSTALRTAHPPAVFNDGSGLAAIRLAITPLFAFAFLLSGTFAPNRSTRIALLAAAIIEAAVFACVAFIWFQPFRSH
jgi:hypothetical protein